jgi:hypothetical protein
MIIRDHTVIVTQLERDYETGELSSIEATCLEGKSSGMVWEINAEVFDFRRVSVH